MTQTGIPREQAEEPEVSADSADIAPDHSAEPGRRRRRARRRILAAGVVLVVAAGGAAWWIAGHASGGSVRTITITANSCAAGWKPAAGGNQSFTIVNRTGSSGEIYLLDGNGGVISEIEGLPPHGQRTMTVAVPNGGYKWACIMTDQPLLTSTVEQISGSTVQAAPAVLPASEDELAGPVKEYQDYVAPKLADLGTQVNTLRGKITAGDIPGAQAAWLTAQLTWEQVGAAYGSFEDLGDAIDGLPDGLPKGVQDDDFTGLHRVEYGLWHGEDRDSLLPVVDQLTTDITTLRGKLPSLTIDPNDLSLRAHEILEDALRDHITGITDQGAGAGFAETAADLQGTRVVLDELAPLLDKRRSDLMTTARQQMDTLDAALQATHAAGGWLNPATAPVATRERVSAALSGLLETLSAVPDLLEVRSAAQATK